MRLTADVESTVRRYVLGDLEEETPRSELEELLVTDPDAFLTLGVIEDELIEEYLDETGSPAERRSLERCLLSSPVGKSRIRLARTLRSSASAASRRPQPWAHPEAVAWLRPWAKPPVWVGLAATLVLSLVGNLWQASHRAAPPLTVEAPPATTLPTAASPPPTGSDVERHELVASLAREQSARALAEARVKALEQEQGARAPMVAYTLAAGLLRGGGSVPRVSVPKDVPLVQMRLELPGDDYPHYRAALVDANGDEIWTASKLRVEGPRGTPAAILWLPAGLLSRGDYQLKLSGVTGAGEREAVASYPFRVSAAAP